MTSSFLGHLSDQVVTTADHTKTKARSPQTNGICERFHKTMLDEFYRVAFRKKIYRSLEELQKDVDHWLEWYNNERVHQGKRCQGRTPMETLRENEGLAREKIWAMMKRMFPSVKLTKSFPDSVVSCFLLGCSH